MKTLLLVILALLCSRVGFTQSNLFPHDGQVSIGTITPDTSSVLEIKSTNLGVLIPRLTKSKRDLIQFPAAGLLIYQTNSTAGFYYYNGTLWTRLGIADANTTLSNLQQTAVNVSLVPSADNASTLGTLEKKWSTLYVKQVNIDEDAFVSDGINETSDNTFIGVSHNITNTTGNRNVWVGTDAGRGNTTGYDNAFVGKSAGKTNKGGSRNSFFGMNAGLSTNGGLKNTFLGYRAGQTNINGLSNTFVGYKAGFLNTNGGFNTFFGDQAGDVNVLGAQNVYFGSNSGTNNAGSNNTCIGYSSGALATTGNNNTFIGANADATLVTATNAIAVGYMATLDQGNVIRMGNADVSKMGVGCSPLTDDILDFQVTTAKLTTGGVWTNASDRKLKNNFQDLNANDILGKVNQLKIQRWHYIADRDASTHIGPVAQDFHQLFGVGDDTTISTIDPSGVALLAIQTLTERGQKKDETIAQQQAEINELKSMIGDMQQSISQCCTSYQDSKEQTNNSIEQGGAYLEQNAPNPFSANTLIKCYLPSATKSAILVISSVDGNELKIFPLSNSGLNEITLQGGALPAGEYFYSLMIDRKQIDSKRMLLTQ